MTKAHTPSVAHAILLFALLSACADQSSYAPTIIVEDTRAKIGWCTVHMALSHLEIKDGYLRGKYEVEVIPVLWKNDSGRVEMELPEDLATIREQGGTLIGSAYSDNPDEPTRKLVCIIPPQQDDHLTILLTTPDRTIKFETKYRLQAAEEAMENEPQR